MATNDPGLNRFITWLVLACLMVAEFVLLANIYLEDDGILTLKFLHRVHKDNM
jgi:hypothetical protein